MFAQKVFKFHLKLKTDGLSFNEIGRAFHNKGDAV